MDPQVAAVLDEGLICHVGYDDEGPMVVPTLHARSGDVVYLQPGAPELPELATGGLAVCVTVTLTEGIVLGRGLATHAVNYRAAVVRGRAVPVPGEERGEALDVLVEHVLAGRSTHSRPATEAELAGLQLLRVEVEEAWLAARSGPPVDDPGDVALPHWAGVLGVRPTYGPALPAPDLPYGRQVPSQVAHYNRSARPQGYR